MPARQLLLAGRTRISRQKPDKTSMNAPAARPPHLELPDFDNSYAVLPAAFYTRLNRLPLPAP